MSGGLNSRQCYFYLFYFFIFNVMYVSFQWRGEKNGSNVRVKCLISNSFGGSLLGLAAS